MKIGDKVKLEDPINGTLIGIIIDKITPSYKCKGSGEWVVDFEDHGKRSIKVKNSKLKKLGDQLKVKPNLLGFKFN